MIDGPVDHRGHGVRASLVELPLVVRLYVMRHTTIAELGARSSPRAWQQARELERRRHAMRGWPWVFVRGLR